MPGRHQGHGHWLWQLSVPLLQPQSLFYVFCTQMQIKHLIIIIFSQITLFRCLSFILLSCHSSHKRDLNFPINGERLSPGSPQHFTAQISAALTRFLQPTSHTGSKLLRCGGRAAPRPRLAPAGAGAVPGTARLEAQALCQGCGAQGAPTPPGAPLPSGLLPEPIPIPSAPFPARGFRHLGRNPFQMPQHAWLSKGSAPAQAGIQRQPFPRVRKAARPPATFSKLHGDSRASWLSKQTRD